MEFLLSLLAHALKQVWPIPILLLIFLFLCVFVGRKIMSVEKVLLVAIVAIVLVIIVFFARNYIIVPIVNHYGVLTEAKVLSSSGTLFFDSSFERQYRYKAIYKKADGKVQEVSYWTRSRNIYPHSASARVIPKSVGDSFYLKYLPMFPRSFIFVATSPGDNKRCRDIAREIAEIEMRLEFEENNEAYQLKLFELEVQQEQCKN